jgi:hypothetical protein
MFWEIAEPDEGVRDAIVAWCRVAASMSWTRAVPPARDSKERCGQEQDSASGAYTGDGELLRTLAAS